MIFLRFIYYFKLAFFYELFNIKSKDKAFADSVFTNFSYKTYRFRMNAPSDYLISLRVFKMIIKNIFKKGKVRLNAVQSDVAIYDTSLNDWELRYNYINRLSNDEAYLQIAKEDLRYSSGFFNSILILLAVLFTYPLIIILSFCSKNKLKYPLHIINGIETFNLFSYLRKYKIRKLHFFSIYECDSNFIAYVLMKSKVFVNKITSEVAIQFWNRIIVADSIALCFRYQRDEVMTYKSTIHANEFLDWVPEGAFELEPIYFNKNRETKPKSIGFYSSGMWLREAQGNLDLDNANIYEELLLKLLIAFSHENKEFKFEIFLHPLEKQNFEKSIDYYSKLSASKLLADIHLVNAEALHHSDVVVSLYSTLAFRRIFWGFKTIIFPLGQEDFPLEKSTFNNVCAKSKNELEAKLKYALNVSTDTYFIETGIADYRYTNYDFFTA